MSDGHGKNQQDSHETDNTMASVDPDAQRVVGACSEEADDSPPVLECAICLQPCVHPVRLPCSHMFCYLCMKGVAVRNRRCALCRADIPEDFVRRPILVAAQEAVQSKGQEPSSDNESQYRWYYEGVDGWWQYDERTSTELETRHQERQSNPDDKSAVFEIVIAGFIYVVDFEKAMQYRRGYPRRLRRIKRDLANIRDCKGIAGIKRPKKQLPQRRDGDGGERTVDGAVAGAAVANSSVVQPSASAAAASGIMPRAAAAPRPSPVPAEDSPMAVGAVAGTVLPSRSAAPSFIRSTADGQRALDDLDQVTGQMASLGVGDGLRQRRRVDRTSEDQVGGRSQSASKRP